MRIKIIFTANTEKVPNNLSVVNSYINKCLGINNKYHDRDSDYSISRLLGGIIIDNGQNIEYSKRGYILVSSINPEFLNKLILGVFKNKSIGYGMKFQSIEHIQETFYNGWNYFKTTDMGFMLKKPRDHVDNVDDKYKGYYTLDNCDLADVLKKHIINKFSKINPNLNFSGLEIVIDEHPKHKVKYRYSKHVKNAVNICQININTNKKLAKALYDYGIGQSCGSGFGMIYTTQFHDLYK